MPSTLDFVLQPSVEDRDLVGVVPVIDGLPLTERVHGFERTAGMEQRAESYDGLVPWSFRFGPPATHYLAGPDGVVDEHGRVPLLGCTCGDWGCWPLLARVESDARAVRWTGFAQPHRPTRDYSAFGPFVFSRADYDAALARLTPRWPA